MFTETGLQASNKSTAVDVNNDREMLQTPTWSRDCRYEQDKDGGEKEFDEETIKDWSLILKPDTVEVEDSPRGRIQHLRHIRQDVCSNWYKL